VDLRRRGGDDGEVDCGLILRKVEGFFVKFSERGGRTAD